MEQSRQKLSDLLHGSALPPPPRNRSLILGTIAAIVAAVACGMAAYTHELPIGYLTLGIGVVIGLAIIRARGYGTPLMIAASALTAAAIIGAYFLTFWLALLSRCNEQEHGYLTYKSAAWKALENPSDDQVVAFADEWSFDYTTREAFDRYPGTMLNWFADNQPTLSEWRSWESDNRSFGEHLQATASAADVAFGLIAALLAAGLVYLRTSKLEHKAKQKAIVQRQQ